MSSSREAASQIIIKLAGQEIQQEMDNVMDVVVDQHAYLPDMFRIRFYDETMEMLDGPFDLTKEVEIIGYTEAGNACILVKGEITSLEPVFDEGMVSSLIVQGYDCSHRLYREAKSRAFVNVRDSDLATQIAQEAGLEADVARTDVIFEHIYQQNQSDLTFLRQRAWRIGYECFATANKLIFRLPSNGSPDSSLAWGEDLISFRPRMSLAEQVNSVEVRGWDAANQRPIVGQAKNGNLAPQIGEQKDGGSWAGSFGQGRQVILDQPVINQAEADALAAARMDEVSGAFVEAEGVAFRHPDIRAGSLVKLENLGKRFSGVYRVTSARHTFSNRGLYTTFRVTGARTGTLAATWQHLSSLPRWPGVVTAVVTNADDPNGWGRVKVKFPWMADDVESDWARVLGIGAGPESGFCATPAVGDEVIVAFEHGEFNQPMVLGGLWNGQHALPSPSAGAGEGEKPLVRSWRSRGGHQLTMFDDAANKLELATAGGHQVQLDDANRTIAINSGGGHRITLDDIGRKVRIESGGEVVVKAATKLTLQAGVDLEIKSDGTLQISANGTVTVRGATINLN